MKKRPIPAIFYSTVEEEPIQHCQMCERNLMTENVPYFIEKAFRKKETIYEFALCLDCMEEMRKRMSKESMKKMQEYMLQNDSFHARMESEEDYDEEKQLGHCAITNTPLEDLNEYQIMGIFEGSEMIVNQFPYLIGSQVMDDLQELLSAETREELDRFKDEYFKVPPELADLFKDTPILIS